MDVIQITFCAAVPAPPDRDDGGILQGYQVQYPRYAPPTTFPHARRRQGITVPAAYAKNGESRSVPMNAVLLSTLRACRMTACSADAPVFWTPQGTPYKNFRTAFERAVAQAGIPDFTFHDLWHTFASRLVMAGVDLPTVQALPGHKTIAMTLRYTHLTTDHKHRAVRLLEPVADKVPAHFTTAHRTWGGARS